MAINPQISLGVRPPVIAPLQIVDPLERYAKVQTLRQLMQQGQLRELQTQQAQQELEQGRLAAEGEANFRKLYADPTARPTDPQVYGTLGPKGAAVIKTQRDIAKTQEERQENYMRLIGNAALSSKTQQDRDFRINALSKAGVIPQEMAAQMLAQPFNLEETQAYGQMTMTVAEQMREKREADARAFAEKKQPFELRTAAAGATKAEQEAAGTQPITPQQKAQAEAAAKATEVTELEIGGKPHKVLVNKQTGEVVKDLGLSGFKPQQVNVNANASLLDRESARFAKPHEKSIADSNSQLEKINEARSLINGPATAQALGVPKVLSALVGGAGSGLRMTKAELDAIAKARGISGDVEGFIRKVSGGGTLTPEQQRDLTGLLDDVATRIVQKQSVANDALDRINSAGSREEIVRIDSEVRRKLSGPQSTGSAPAASGQYKAGDTRVINGKTYTRDANGNWK